MQREVRDSFSTDLFFATMKIEKNKLTTPKKNLSKGLCSPILHMKGNLQSLNFNSNKTITYLLIQKYLIRDSNKLNA